MLFKSAAAGSHFRLQSIPVLARLYDEEELSCVALGKLHNPRQLPEEGNAKSHCDLK